MIPIKYKFKWNRFLLKIERLGKVFLSPGSTTVEIVEWRSDKPKPDFSELIFDRLETHEESSLVHSITFKETVKNDILLKTAYIVISL